MTLDDLARLCEEATAGPWTPEDSDEEPEFLAISPPGAYGYPRESHIMSASYRRQDRDFIVAARTYLPRLIEVARAAQGLHNRSAIGPHDADERGLQPYWTQLRDALATLEAPCGR